MSAFDLAVLIGDCRERLRELAAGSAQCCVTSPPYWGLRDYGVEGQLGLEATPEEYVANMVDVFREVRRVLADDGTLWLNLGDSYAAGGRGGGGSFMDERAAWSDKSTARGFRGPPAGLKPKDLVGIPWRLALALQADGWYLRCDIVWEKSNPTPSSVLDRPNRSHEYVFLLSKREHYFYDQDPLREPHETPIALRQRKNGKRAMRGQESLRPRGNLEAAPDAGARYFHPLGRAPRSVWRVATQPSQGAHFAVMPTALVEPCVLAGSRVGDLVIDPFCGAGTVGLVARRRQRRFYGVELNPEYAAMAEARIVGDAPLLEAVVS